MAGFRLGATSACAVAAAATLLLASAVGAQEGERQERSPFLLDRLFGSSERPQAPVGQERAAQQSAQSPSDLIVRLDRLEAQIRQLTGTVEQLQFRNQQLEQHVRRPQEDTEFRLQELGSKSGARPSARSPTPPLTSAPASTSTVKRGDAFDPSQNPGAPGAPQTLGTIAGRDHDTAAAANPVVASAPAGQTPKDDFDIAYSFMVRKDYALAEDGFRGFLKRYPNDKLTPEASYWFGESMFQRQRYREAAEAFLSVSTKHESSPKAPDALFRLGQSLAALGEKEAACASLGEVTRKFPRASASLRQSVEREQKRVRC